MPTFDYQSSDGQVIFWVAVSIPLLEGSDSRTFEALLDTGAQKTMITQNVVNQLAAVPTGVGKFIAVNGVEQPADLYTLRIEVPVQEPDETITASDTILSFSRPFDFTALLMPYEPSNFDVLLGMDLIEKFHISAFGKIWFIST